MAIAIDFDVLSPVLSYTFADFNGNVATTTHYPPPGTAHAEVVTGAQNLASDLDNVSTAEIIKARIVYEAVNTLALAQAARPSSSNVKDKLKMVYKSSNPRSGYTVEVPSPSTDAEQEGTDVALRTEADLAGLIDEMLNGPWGLANGLRTGSGFDLTELDQAFYSVRNREPNR